MVVALAALHPSQLQLRASVASGTKRGKQFRFGDVDSVIVTVNVSFEKKNTNNKKVRRCRGSNPGRPRDRRKYLPLYYNDLVEFVCFMNVKAVTSYTHCFNHYLFFLMNAL